MPRTKYVRSSKVRSKFSTSKTKTKQEFKESRESSQDLISLWLSNYERDAATAVFNFNNRTETFMEQIDQIIVLEFSAINPSLLKKSIGELKTEKSFSVSSMKSMMGTTSILKHLSSTTNTTFTSKKKKQTDEGYLTAGESETRTHGRSSSTSRQSRQAHREPPQRASRSLSRSKPLARNVTIQEPEKKTPHKSIRPPIGFGMVTPKVKPNMPVSVLRRPKQGEMAISMQGSPLLVSGVVTETCANVNIPLHGDRILSLQPSKTLRVSEIPTLDEETRQQLLMLRDNIDKMVEIANED